MPWAGYWWSYSQNDTRTAFSKYVAAAGRRDAAEWEASNHSASTPGVEDWWGHCNGWAVASIFYEEPKSAHTENGVTFNVSDQKALLSEIGMEAGAEFFGIRSESDDPSSRSFQDVFPNQFFLVLTNYVGQGFPLVMDRYTGYQVWNHPIAGYRIAPVREEDYLGSDPENPNVHRVMTTAQVWWVRADVEPGHQSESFGFSDGPSYDSRTYRFEIWLDGQPRFNSSGDLESSGNVILASSENFVLGGAWRNGGLEGTVNSHPDYLWIPTQITSSTGFTNPFLDQRWLERTFARRAQSLNSG